MLDKSHLVVREVTKLFVRNHEILDGETGNVVATGIRKGGLPSNKTEVRSEPDKVVLFSVIRGGMFFFKRIDVFAEGCFLGSYKEKFFSLFGGFYVYDERGKLFAKINGSFSEYRVLTPDGDAEIGSLSKTWRGVTREWLMGVSGATGVYHVHISPEYMDNDKAKILILAFAER